jgi:hypothetical protein
MKSRKGFGRLVWDVGQATPKLASKKLAKEDLERTWADLAAEDARKAHEAFWILTAAPLPTVPLLRDRLKPITPVEAGKVQQWITDLDSAKFATRQAAPKIWKGSAARPRHPSAKLWRECLPWKVVAVWRSC